MIACQPNILHFTFFKSFFTDIICSQSLRRNNFTITLSLFFLSWWYAASSWGDSSHTISLKTVSTLSSISLLLTLLGIPATSMHSLLEYWTFAKHCLYISIKSVDRKDFSCFVTAFSSSSWVNLWFTLRISSSIKSFFFQFFFSFFFFQFLALEW